jgi:hypothetical protein
MYPTKDQILAEIFQHKQETIQAIWDWKIKWFKGWRDKNSLDRLNALTDLIRVLNEIEKTEVEFCISDHYSYNPKKKIISLDLYRLSILSTLHEFGHHLLGKSELKACRWSIFLFKECFPQSFHKLSWQDHLLVR